MCWLNNCIKWKWKSLSRAAFYDPMDYTVHGILQARTLEKVAFPFSRGSSQSKACNQVSHIAGGFFISWATREANNCIYQLLSTWNPVESHGTFSPTLSSNYLLFVEKLLPSRSFPKFQRANLIRKVGKVRNKGKESDQKKIIILWLLNKVLSC